jgi:hypothetical protein
MHTCPEQVCRRAAFVSPLGHDDAAYLPHVTYEWPSALGHRQECCELVFVSPFGHDVVAHLPHLTYQCSSALCHARPCAVEPVRVSEPGCFR